MCNGTLGPFANRNNTYTLSNIIHLHELQRWLLLGVTIYPDLSMLSLTSEVVLTPVFPVPSLCFMSTACVLEIWP